MALCIGEDFEWLGVDCDGHVARFTTAGPGPVPQAIQEAEGDVRHATDALYDLPKICDAELLAKLPNPDDFKKLSESGIFGYDWDDVHRPIKQKTGQYNLISRPRRPSVISKFPIDIPEAAFVRFPNTRFANETSIDVVSLMRCVLPG